MAQYDIHALGAPRNAPRRFPATYVVDLQASLYAHLPTRLVAPLVPASVHGKPFERINPIIELDGRSYVLVIQQSVGLTTRDLGPVVGSAAGQADAIKDALDLLLLGI